MAKLRKQHPRSVSRFLGLVLATLLATRRLSRRYQSYRPARRSTPTSSGQLSLLPVPLLILPTVALLQKALCAPTNGPLSVIRKVTVPAALEPIAETFYYTVKYGKTSARIPWNSFVVRIARNIAALLRLTRAQSAMARLLAALARPRLRRRALKRTARRGTTKGRSSSNSSCASRGRTSERFSTRWHRLRLPPHLHPHRHHLLHHLMMAPTLLTLHPLPPLLQRTPIPLPPATKRSSRPSGRGRPSAAVSPRTRATRSALARTNDYYHHQVKTALHRSTALLVMTSFL